MTDHRDLVMSWVAAGLAAVDPERLVGDALGARSGAATVIAVGKAAPGMCRGAAAVLDAIDGICISDHREEVPEGIELMIGDHPVPGQASLAAGRRALELANSADLALISGGGSSLCEVPRPGVELDDLVALHQGLLTEGVDIEEANLVRASISRIKCGGLGPLPTYVLSDVGPGGPDLVASGPTIPRPIDPSRVRSVLARHGIGVEPWLERVMDEPVPARPQPPLVEVIGDGRTAARAVAEAARGSGIEATVRNEWLHGPVDDLVRELIRTSPSGVTVAAGEPGMGHVSGGRGGRNTHAALLAASITAGTGTVFAAVASDGVDGPSGSAGAVVDGNTVDRGGDPASAIAGHDSATYLELTGDLIPGGATGTNVADLWLIWKPDSLY